MKRIALLLLSALLFGLLNAAPSAAYSYVWNLADPSALVAYQVGTGVITVASTNLLTCQSSQLMAETKPFVYDYKVASPGKGMLCMSKYAAQIASYYQAGSVSTVKVHTKSGVMNVPVQAAPPASNSTSHLPFH